MPKVKMPEQYKGYLSEWDIFGLQPMAGITLLGMGKGLKKAGYSKQLRGFIYELLRRKPGIKKTKEIIKGIPRMEAYESPVMMGREVWQPEDLLGFHHPFKGVGLRKAGFKGSPPMQDVETALHELIGHEAHGKVIKKALTKKMGIQPGEKLTQNALDAIDIVTDIKIRQAGKGEDIAEAIAADIMGRERHAWEILQANPDIFGKSIEELRKISKIRAKAIMRKATQPTQGFLPKGKKQLLLTR